MNLEAGSKEQNKSRIRQESSTRPVHSFQALHPVSISNLKGTKESVTFIMCDIQPCRCHLVIHKKSLLVLLSKSLC